VLNIKQLSPYHIIIRLSLILKLFYMIENIDNLSHCACGCCPEEFDGITQTFHLDIFHLVLDTI
jgi:hypothetical protein